MEETYCFTYFTGSTDDHRLPEKFTFPFYYEPHPLALLACQELQNRIENEIRWDHDFGLDHNSSNQAIGKMFGVLVVENNQGELGYLSAFSGKLEGENLDNIFVPTIYHRFNKEDHFAIETKKLDQLTIEIAKLEAEPKLNSTREIYEIKKQEHGITLQNEKAAILKYSKERKLERKQLKSSLPDEDFDILHQLHIQESINDKFKLKAYSEYLDKKLAKFEAEYRLLYDKIVALKNQRKSMSNQLQAWLFAQYNFLNSKGDSRNVVELFEQRIPNVPPSGAGDCAAPKLLQYAYQKGYDPIALAEFWWGKAPDSEVRKRFLSVPGIHITDSVQERMLKKYPDANGPMIVHRLDMSTSGLMVVAKSKDVHKSLQMQFKNRRVTKRYVALLDGVLDNDEGHIDLPLKVDHDNRPFQIVCYENGKHCRTKWEVTERKDSTTKVNFYPLSGQKRIVCTYMLRLLHLNIRLQLN